MVAVDAQPGCYDATMKAGRTKRPGRDVGAEREQPRERPRDARGERRQIVFGVEPVREMLAADAAAVQTLFVRARDESRFAQEIARVRGAGGRVAAVEEGELARLAGSEARHQGMVAEVRACRYAELEELLAARPDPLLLIDGITDPRNLGATLRVVECVGLPGLILARDRTVGITPAAIKTSAGAWAHLRIAQCGNVAQTLERLKESDYWVAALVPEGDISLYDLDVTRHLAIVVGAEGEGLRRLVKEKADFLVRVPMLGRVSSLNVAVATGIVLFEINRHRAAASA
jgi:23S rRNA (guanosine2251-2'-O)-methyltransferase